MSGKDNEDYDQLKRSMVSLNLKELKLRNEMPLNMQEFSKKYHGLKNGIEALVEDHSKEPLQQPDIRIIRHLVEYFTEFLEATVTISHWTEGFNDNTKIKTLHRHFCKFVFPKDAKPQTAIQSKEFLHQDLQGTFLHYNRQMNWLITSIDTVHREIYSLQTELDGNPINKMFRSAKSYLNCLDSLTSRIKQLKSVLNGIGSFHFSSTLFQSLSQFTDILSSVTDNFEQIIFLSSCMILSLKISKELIERGNFVEAILGLERMVLMNYDIQEISKKIDALHLQGIQCLGRDAISSLQQIKGYLQWRKPPDTREELRHLRLSICQTVSEKCSLSHNSIICNAVELYRKECVKFLQKGEKLLDVFVSMHFLQTEDVMSPVSDFLISCDGILNYSKMLFKKLNWQNVLGNSRRQSSTGSQNLAALISKAVSCKRQNLAHLMELMSTKPEPEDLVSYSFHCDHLLVVVKPICELFECLKNPQEAENSLNMILNQHFTLITSNNSSSIGGEEDFHKDVMQFIDFFTSLLDDFLNENHSQLPFDSEDLQLSHPVESTEWVTIRLQFLCDYKFLGNNSMNAVGVDVITSLNKDPISFKKFTGIDRKGCFTIAQCQFGVRKGLKKLYYRYSISHEPEMLHVDGTKLVDVDRCYRVLNIPANQGEVCTFDSVAQRRKRQSGFWAGFRRMTTWSIEFQIPERSNDIQTALNCYLETSISSLQETFHLTEEDVKYAHRNIDGVIKHFEQAKVVDIKADRSILFYQDSFAKETLKWLELALSSIKESQSSQKIVSVLVLNRCILEVPTKNREIFTDIISMFHPTFTERKECLEYDVIMTTIPDASFRKDFIDSLVKLLSKCTERSGKLNLEMWNLLCFIHWFEHKSSQKPFAEVPSEVKDLMKSYHQSKNHLPNNPNTLSKRDLEQSLKNIHFQCLLEADFMLQFLLFQLCPESKYPLISNFVQSPILITCVCMSVICTERKCSEENLQHLNILMKNLFEKKDQIISKYTDVNSNILNFFLSWMKDHFHEDERKMLLQSESLKNLVFTVLQFLLCSYIVELKTLQDFISEYASACFGTLFANGTQKSCISKEAKFWSQLCDLSTLNNEWREGLVKLIINRIDKSNRSIMILFVELEGEKESIAFLAIKKILEDEFKDILTSQKRFLESQEFIENSTSLKLMFFQHINAMFSESTFNWIDLVSHSFWPLALGTAELHGEDISFCSVKLKGTIKKMLEETLISQLTNLEVSSNELSHLRKKWESHFLPIFEALQMKPDNFFKALKKCWENLCVFELFIVVFDFFLNSTSIESLSSIKKSFHVLKQKYHELELKSLCIEFEKNSYRFPYCSEADQLIQMLIPFAIMNSEEYKNDIFVCKWRDALKANKGIVGSEVPSLIWEPVFSDCTQLLYDLEHEEVTISKAVALFEKMDKGGIEQSIKKMASGVKTCAIILKLGWKNLALKLVSKTSKIQIDTISKAMTTQTVKPDWITQVASKIDDWCCVQRLSEMADTMIEIVEDLDSSTLEMKYLNMFSSQNIKFTMDSTKLNDLKYEMEVVKKQLEKTKCFKTDVWVTIKQFSKLTELTQWIKEKSKNLHEMENFISVAMGTIAGEGHEIQDRFSDLSILCSSFSPLLYHLNEGGRKTLKCTLTCIFEAAKKLSESKFDLNTILSTCSSHLQWYVSQGELQGSVEKGAVKELEDINTFGKYNVELSKETQVYEINLFVLTETGAMQKHYCLNDLQELESKLVLITRQCSVWADSKKAFQLMLQQIVRITDVMQKLKDYGHIKYLTWSQEFSCSDYCATEDFGKLVQITDSLENELLQLINHVWQCRQKFYYLNFYTNQQLMLLRMELTALQDDPTADANPQLFHLLQSVTGHFLTSTFSIRKALKGENIETSHDCQEEPALDSDKQISIQTQVDSEAPSVGQSCLDKAIGEFTESELKIFTELTEQMNYDKVLSVKAIQQIDACDLEVFTAMEWCDNHMDEQFLQNLNQEWEVETSRESQLINSSQDELPQHDERIHKTFKEGEFKQIGAFFIPFLGSKEKIEHEPSLSQCDHPSSSSFESLGKFLQCFSEISYDDIVQDRLFPNYCKLGTPNLIVVPPEFLFLAVLQIYYEDREKPLPCFTEVLLCSQATTLEEVAIFLMRAIYDPHQSKIYCLVHAEKLKYLTARKATDLINFLSQGKPGYRLIIFCSSEGEEKSIIVSRLHTYHRNIPDIKHESLRSYVRYHICNTGSTKVKKVFASSIDADKSRVRVILSKRSGVGKSLYVRRKKESLVKYIKQLELTGQNKLTESIATVPLHGPIVTADEVLSMLLPKLGSLQSSIIHLDIQQRVMRSIDDILFSLMILHGLCNSNGCIWRCLSTQYYLIEIVIPLEQHFLSQHCETRRVVSLLNLLPTNECIGPVAVMSPNYVKSANQISIDCTEICTPMYQRVYQYLMKIENNEQLENFKYAGTMLGDEESCLMTIMSYSGIQQPSWKEIRHFVWFLNVQLSACEQFNLLSRYKGLKSFLVKFMLEMSRDFATSSISEDKDQLDVIESHKVRKLWQECMHPYIFFNKNRTSVTYIGFHLSKMNSGNLVLKDDSTNLPIPNLQLTNEVILFLENEANVPCYNQLGLQNSSTLLEQLAKFMNIKWNATSSPDTNYVLTQDNLTKIMGIQMRFRCRIPVVLMGETGCGKTHLIRFMCKFAKYGNRNVQNMFILKIHGGTTEEDVLKCIKQAEMAALHNRKHGIETVVFFDEANTSDVISLIKEVMCDGRCRGQPLPPFLKFVAACNPYREHDQRMKEKLRNAGLGWCESNTEVVEKLGEIPMRDLVYRVLDLPSSMKALVYDFGRLPENTEKEYIRQIVTNRIQANDHLNQSVIQDIANILSDCQTFMRELKDECSFVSLRDIERTAIVFNYFYCYFTDFFKIKLLKGINKLTCSLILAISVCYHSRIEKLDKRGSFEKCIVKVFHSSKHLTHIEESDFIDVIKKFQLKLLDSMQLQKNIARNSALRENVFMMVICIELRIPLFLVGKPGSSKSLAKSIVADSLHGAESAKNILKNFKKVQLHSHQCSPLSTPASIIEVFHIAKSFQDRRDNATFASVVVLDEVGLAEASPHLPLKALHPLLEDGTEGSGSSDERYDRSERVAFIGISNWALDPAKMNRGIMVTRGDPGIKELIDSASGICHGNKETNKTYERLESLFPMLSSAYLSISKDQKRQFFGLRDFYSLIKMLYWMSDKSSTMLTKAQLLHAIKRNFDGYNNDEVDPVKIFGDFLNPDFDFSSESGDLIVFKSQSSGYLTVTTNDQLTWGDKPSIEAQFVCICERKSMKKSFQSLVKPDLFIGYNSETSEMILKPSKASLECYSRSGSCNLVSLRTKQGELYFGGVHEFFLLSPEDSVTNPKSTPLELIQASLLTRETTWHGENRYLLFLTENYSALQTLKQYIMTITDSLKSDGIEGFEPFVLFGSNFPKDSEYTQVCRNISEVRLCMETGRMVILLNLENLYESLYDVLNQYYMESGGHRYVDLGLRTNRMKCRVNEQFKLILIAEKTKVYQEFPVPLVNRMEKHFVSSKTILKEWQHKLCIELEKWMDDFTKCNKESSSFSKLDVFIGYSCDTVAAVVLQATSKKDLLLNLSHKEKSNEWTSVVFEISKCLLLQLATPDGVCRYLSTEPRDQNRVEAIYFLKQEHSSLSLFFQRLGENKSGQLIQVTTHASTLSEDDLNSFVNQINCNKDDVARLHLEAFHTEQDFIDSVQNALEKGLHSDHVLLLECDSGHKNGNLIACCRYRIVDLRNNVQLKDSRTCILFLIHLPRSYPKSNFVSFQEHPWICYHIDEVISYTNSITITDLVITDYSIAEVFASSNLKPFDFNDEIHLGHGCNKANYDSLFQTLLPYQQKNLHLCKQLHHFIPEAVILSKLKKDRIEVLQKIIPETSTTTVDIHEDIVHLMRRALQDESKNHERWILEEAFNMQRLQESGSFRQTLMQKLKKIILPLFSNVLAFIDCYNNIEVLDVGDVCHKEAWKVIFKSEELCSCYVTAPGSFEINKDLNMNCEFPFSWVVFKFLSQIAMNPVQGFSGVLANIPMDTRDRIDSLPAQLLESYLHDFIKLVHKTSRSSAYHKVIKSALLIMMDTVQSEFSSESLLESITIIHFLYEKHKPYFEWFDQLISHVPSILMDLESFKNLDIKGVTLQAVDETLASTYFDLKEPFSKGRTALRGWIQKLCQMQSIIEKVSRESTSTETKLNWKWTCLKRMFVEHIVLKNEEVMLFIAKRIEKFSERKDQLKASKTLHILANFLIAVENELKKDNLKDTHIRNAIHESCWQLFIQAVSMFCFGEESILSSPDSIPELMNAAFPALSSENTSKLAQFMRFHPEKCLNYRFWLIKSVCIFSEDHPEVYLDTIFNWFKSSGSGSVGTHFNHALVVSALYLHNHLELKYEGVKSKKIILEGLNKFERQRGDPLSPSCLTAISQIQYSCQLLADCIHNGHSELNNGELVFFSHQITKPEVNDEESYTGPFWYFLRVMARRHGLSLLLEAPKHSEFEWMKSHDIVYNEMEGFHHLDQVAIYNPVYDDIRSAVNALLRSDPQATLKSTPLRTEQIVPLILAIYERLHQSFVSRLPSKQIKSTDVIKDFVSNCKQFRSYPKISQIVNEIVLNTHCHELPQMAFSDDEPHNDSIIRAIVVHTVVTLLVHQRNKLTRIFTDILIQPKALKNFSLPTMHQIENSICSVSFPQCSSSHIHTRIMINQICPICGNTVLERKTEVEHSQIRSITLKHGYFPGEPNIGFLPPISYAIIRCILHSCLLWSSCHNKDFSSLLSEPIQMRPQCFWDKIKQDLQLLCKATGRSTDESALIIHLVIKEIARSGQGIIIGHDVHKQASVEKITTTNEQKSWELQFQESFISPVIEDIDCSMKKVLKNLTPRDHSKLFAALYMNESIPTSGKDTFLWQYYPKITMEHFRLNNIDLTMEEIHPALFLILTKDESLEATQYINEIVHFQRLVHDIAVQNFSVKTRHQLERLSYSEFKCQYFNENQEFIQKRFEALCEAWKLARTNIFLENFLGLDEDLKQKDLNESTSMAFLIPRMQGDGLLTCALIHHLVCLHNSIIEKSRNFVKMTLQREWLVQTQQVHITNIESTDFIDCRSQLFPIILKHACYDFASGHPVIKYDLLGLERELVNYCVLDKREIIGLADIPQTVWEIDSIILFSAVVKEKIPQKELSLLAKADILQELRSIAQLSKTVEVIETIVQYLQREDEVQNPREKLISYAETIKLQLPSVKVGEHCLMENIICLWKFIQIEKEKMHVKNNETPFFNIQGNNEKKLCASQVSLLEESLKKIATLLLEELVEVIYDFIYLYLKHSKADHPLQDALKLFLKKRELKPIQHMEEVLPQEIKVAHAINTWTHIVLYQNKLKKNI